MSYVQYVLQHGLCPLLYITSTVVNVDCMGWGAVEVNKNAIDWQTVQHYFNLKNSYREQMVKK